jgi:hypothetical protein
MTRTTLALLFALASITASAQISIGADNQGASIRVGGGIGLSNGASTLTMLNPNQKGDFLFLFPQMAPMESGKGLPLQLWAVGNDDGRTVFVWKAGATPSAPDQDVVAGGGTKATTATAHLTSAMVDVPAMLANTSTVVRLDVPGIKAGSAISISPSEELPGMLAIAHASAPVDCVVIIKFINPGPFVPGMTMKMSVGALGTASP